MIKNIFDNAIYRTDKFTSHSYLETYDEILSPKKETAASVFEIGVSAGGSILLWRDYFINAQIYGVDVEDTPQDILNSSPERITLFKENAYNFKFIQNFIDNNVQFDILIDDGPHTLESMVFFAKNYPILMKHDGLMIVEDIPNLECANTVINSFPAHLQNKCRIVDLRVIKNRWDDILVICNA